MHKRLLLTFKNGLVLHLISQSRGVDPHKKVGETRCI